MVLKVINEELLFLCVLSCSFDNNSLYGCGIKSWFVGVGLWKVLRPRPERGLSLGPSIWALALLKPSLVGSS